MHDAARWAIFIPLGMRVVAFAGPHLLGGCGDLLLSSAQDLDALLRLLSRCLCLLLLLVQALRQLTAPSGQQTVKTSSSCSSRLATPSWPLQSAFGAVQQRGVCEERTASLPQSG